LWPVPEQRQGRKPARQGKARPHGQQPWPTGLKPLQNRGLEELPRFPRCLLCLSLPGGRISGCSSLLSEQEVGRDTVSLKNVLERQSRRCTPVAAAPATESGNKEPGATSRVRPVEVTTPEHHNRARGLEDLVAAPKARASGKKFAPRADSKGSLRIALRRSRLPGADSPSLSFNSLPHERRL